MAFYRGWKETIVCHEKDGRQPIPFNRGRSRALSLEESLSSKANSLFLLQILFKPSPPQRAFWSPPHFQWDSLYYTHSKNIVLFLCCHFPESVLIIMYGYMFSWCIVSLPCMCPHARHLGRGEVETQAGPCSLRVYSLIRGTTKFLCLFQSVILRNAEFRKANVLRQEPWEHRAGDCVYTLNKHLNLHLSYPTWFCLL